MLTKPALRGLLIGGLVLVLAFAKTWVNLARLSIGSELYSYIPLMPLIVAGSLWMRKNELSSRAQPKWSIPAAFFVAGLAALAALMIARPAAPVSAFWQGVNVLPFVLWLAALCAWGLDSKTVRTISFPMAFLLLMIPLPIRAVGGIESFLQHASAKVAYLFFETAGTPVFLHGLVGLKLPGIDLDVAPQCSGIRSSLALFVTALPASYLFLRSPWRRALLVLATIPLGIIRNGFRIFTIGELCVHIGPHMIDSYIHHTGGWIFYLLSLLPLFALAWLLIRMDAQTFASKDKT